MDEKTPLGSVTAQWQALVALACLVLVPCLAAGWLNSWSVFAFPLGTFLVALIIPFALIGVVMVWSRTPVAEVDEA